MLGVLLCFFAYIFGSMSFAIIVCKIFNLPDPRTIKSKNPGTTNVLRIGGKFPAMCTLLGDCLKGFIPAIIVAVLLKKEAFLASIVVLFAFLGHVYPIFFKFKGGKGIATVIGGFLGINYIIGFSFVLVWLITFFISKLSSLSALFATFITPFVAYIFLDLKTTIIISGICVLVFYTHKSNIKRLLNREEQKI